MTIRPLQAGVRCGAFPRKAQPKLAVEIDTLVGTLNYGSVRIATGTTGYKHCALDTAVEAMKLAAPNFLLKIIPHVDGTTRVCELVRFHLEDITVKGAWTGPAALDLYSHARLMMAAERKVVIIVGTSEGIGEALVKAYRDRNYSSRSTMTSSSAARPRELQGDSSSANRVA